MSFAIALKRKLGYDNYTVSPRREESTSIDHDSLQIYEKASDVGGTWRVGH